MSGHGQGQRGAPIRGLCSWWEGSRGADGEKSQGIPGHGNLEPESDHPVETSEVGGYCLGDPGTRPRLEAGTGCRTDGKA